MTGFIAMFTLLRWCVAGSILPPRNACMLQWAVVKRPDSLGLMASQEECSVAFEGVRAGMWDSVAILYD